MKPALVRVLTALAVATLAAFATWRVARAYVIQARWPLNSATYTYSYYLPQAFQNGTDRGAYRWTKVKRSSWVWIKNATSLNWIHYGNIDGRGGILGQTFRYGNPITNFTITYDRSENWYTGADIPASNQVDLESIAAHEFGHALGLGHTQSTYCTGAHNTWATMCGAYLLGAITPRTLEDDDKNGVSALYPP